VAGDGGNTTGSVATGDGVLTLAGLGGGADGDGLAAGSPHPATSNDARASTFRNNGLFKMKTSDWQFQAVARRTKPPCRGRLDVTKAWNAGDGSNASERKDGETTFSQASGGERLGADRRTAARGAGSGVETTTPQASRGGVIDAAATCGGAHGGKAGSEQTARVALKT
jgi:hypothetical protein